MKKRKIFWGDLFLWTSGAFVFLVAAVMSIILISGSDNPERARDNAFFAVLTIGCVWIAVEAIIIMLSKKQKKEQATRELTAEYQTVRMTYSSFIPNRYFKCKAKVDDDGKIRCKVQCDFEITLNDYEEFVNVFALIDDE